KTDRSIIKRFLRSWPIIDCMNSTPTSKGNNMKKLNPLAVISLRDQIADKKPLDQRTQYFTATLAIAIAMAIPVPVSVESPLDAFNTAYRGAYENVVYDINETVSVSVDRVRQMAFKLWEIHRYRYGLVDVVDEIGRAHV